MIIKGLDRYRKTDFLTRLHLGESQNKRILVPININTSIKGPAQRILPALISYASTTPVAEPYAGTPFTTTTKSTETSLLSALPPKEPNVYLYEHLEYHLEWH